MSEVLFTPADLADLQAFNRANLPHTADVEAWTRVRQPGGTYTTTWAVEAGKSDLPCRLSPATAPQERLSAGAPAEIKEFYVVFDVDVSIAADRRIVVTHDIPGLASPLTVYVIGSSAHSFEMERKVLCSTEGGA